MTLLGAYRSNEVQSVQSCFASAQTSYALKQPASLAAKDACMDWARQSSSCDTKPQSCEQARQGNAQGAVHAQAHLLLYRTS